MLLVPIPEGVNWRRPPPVTLVLILLNALVFFGYQSGDTAREAELTRAYFQSSLPAVELPRYKARVAEEEPGMAKRLERAPRELVFVRMEGDGKFMRALRAGEVVKPAEPAYATWHEDRERIDAIEGRLSFRRFGFTPADPRPVTWVTSMFLHGGLMHLAGNMVFLFILGVAVEAPLGAGWFLALYLLGGLGGDLLQWAVDPSSTVPTVGASGAISGLMGLFAVVFGLRPVRFFYWLFVVFGFRSLRGLAVLPLWIGWELLQSLVARGHSSVAYMEHAGGLAAGALLGAIARHRLVAARVERFHEEREGEQADRADYDKARALAQKLDYAAASTVFARLARRHPADADMMRQWYAIARRTPQLPHYAAATNAVLGLPGKDAATRRWQAEVLAEYMRMGGVPAQLDAAALGRTANRFALSGLVTEAQAAADLLFRIDPAHRYLPAVWDALAKAFARSPADPASQASAKRYRTLIVARARARAQNP
jgi:membrane associated rhomboid family serine protease